MSNKTVIKVVIEHEKGYSTGNVIFIKILSSCVSLNRWVLTFHDLIWPTSMMVSDGLIKNTITRWSKLNNRFCWKVKYVTRKFKINFRNILIILNWFRTNDYGSIESLDFFSVQDFLENKFCQNLLGSIPWNWPLHVFHLAVHFLEESLKNKHARLSADACFYA